VADSSYLGSTLLFYPDRIEVEEGGVQVMMAWERPLMQRMAQIVTVRGGDILEVGFGMGLSCDAVRAQGPRSHTVIEAHPQIIERARAWAQGAANTEIIAARWQEVITELGPFDGISFDIFGGQDQRLEFFGQLDRLLTPRGVATLWIGDDRQLQPPLRAVLDAQGFTHRFIRVSAIPDPRCTYSRSNEFFIPIISRR